MTRAKQTAPTILVTMVFVWLLQSCSATNHEVTIFAASSLAAATERLDAAIAADDKVASANWVLAGSSRLIAQVGDGARPDIIVSADAERLTELVEYGYLLLDEPRLSNRLVLAISAGNPAQISSLNDLSLEKPLIGVCAPEVPCGAAANRVANEFSINIRGDTAEANVRALAHKLANGELDAGLVYVTDAVSLDLATVDDPRLATNDHCTDSNVITYGIAALASAGTTSTTRKANAQMLVERYLLPEVLKEVGFAVEQCP